MQAAKSTTNDSTRERGGVVFTGSAAMVSDLPSVRSACVGQWEPAVGHSFKGVHRDEAVRCLHRGHEGTGKGALSGAGDAVQVDNRGSALRRVADLFRVRSGYQR